MQAYILYQTYSFPIGVFSSIENCKQASKDHYIGDFEGIRSVSDIIEKHKTIYLYDEDNLCHEYLIKQITIDQIIT